MSDLATAILSFIAAFAVVLLFGWMVIDALPVPGQ
jgi:hypothetical protein